MRVLLRRALLGLAALIAFTIVSFFVAVSLKMKVDLSPFREPAERIAASALGREVQLLGAMTPRSGSVPNRDLIASVRPRVMDS